MADSKNTKDSSPLNASNTESGDDPSPEIPNIGSESLPDQGDISKDEIPDVQEDNDQAETYDPDIELSQVTSGQTAEGSQSQEDMSFKFQRREISKLIASDSSSSLHQSKSCKISSAAPEEHPSLITVRTHTRDSGSSASSLRRKVEGWHIESQSAEPGKEQKIRDDQTWRDVPSIIQSDSSSLYQISDSQTSSSLEPKTPTGLQKHPIMKHAGIDKSDSDSSDRNIRKDLQTLHIESCHQSPGKSSQAKESQYEEQACWLQRRDVPPIITSDSSGSLEQAVSTKTSSGPNISLAGSDSLERSARRELEDLAIDSDSQLAEKQRLKHQQEKEAKQQQSKGMVRMDTFGSLDSEAIFGEMEDEPVYDREPIDIDPTYPDTYQQHEMKCRVPVTINTEPMSSWDSERTESMCSEEKSVAALKFSPEHPDDSDHLVLQGTNKKKVPESSQDFMDFEEQSSEVEGCKALLSSRKMDVTFQVEEEADMSVEMPVADLYADASGDSDPLKKDSLKMASEREPFNLPSEISFKLPSSVPKVSDIIKFEPTEYEELKLVPSNANEVPTRTSFQTENIDCRRSQSSSSEEVEIPSMAMRTKLSTVEECSEKDDESLKDFASMIAKGVLTMAKKVCQPESRDLLPDSLSTRKSCKPETPDGSPGSLSARKSCEPETPDIIPFSLLATKPFLSGSPKLAKDKRKRKSEDIDISTFTSPKKISESKKLPDSIVESPAKRMSLMPLEDETMEKQPEISPEKQSRKRKPEQLSGSEETKSPKVKVEYHTQIPKASKVPETKLLSPVRERRKTARLAYKPETSKLSPVGEDPEKKPEKKD